MPPLRPRNHSCAHEHLGFVERHAGWWRLLRGISVFRHLRGVRSALSDRVRAHGFIVRRSWPRPHLRWAAPTACVAGRNATTRSIIEMNGPTVRVDLAASAPPSRVAAAVFPDSVAAPGPRKGGTGGAGATSLQNRPLSAT